MSKPKRAKAYKMPDPLPRDEILQDLSKKQWVLGPSIGKGGFGEIYSAQEYGTKSSSKYPYVIKIEPHENGPLFVEMHFYMKNCKKTDIDSFKSQHELSTLGIPAYLGSGSHQCKGIKYRFIVMERFGEDIDKLLRQNNGELPVRTVFLLAHQMTFVLEYIHSFKYVHADLKGANILLGTNKDNKNQAYLVDFGLGTKFSTAKPFKPNPKKAHDGTIEFLSRDAHQGVPTRRGDFEILGNNIIHWLGGTLPWMQHLTDPKTVHQKKTEHMSDPVKFVKTCFGNKTVPDGLLKFLKYVETLTFDAEPDYKKIRDILSTELKKAGGSLDGPLKFSSSLPTGSKRRSRSVPNSPEKKMKKEKDRAPSADRVPKKKRAQKKEVEAATDVMTPAMKEILAKKLMAKKGAKKVVVENGGLLNGYNEEMKEVAERKHAKKEQVKTDSVVDEEGKPSSRTRRKVVQVNYDESTPKLPRKPKNK